MREEEGKEWLRDIWMKKKLDGMLAAWDCVVEDARRVAVAARDPAGGQRDGLILARKGTPEQRPRPTNASVTA